MGGPSVRRDSKERKTSYVIVLECIVFCPSLFKDAGTEHERDRSVLDFTKHFDGGIGLMHEGFERGQTSASQRLNAVRIVGVLHCLDYLYEFDGEEAPNDMELYVELLVSSRIVSAQLSCMPLFEKLGELFN